MKVSAFVANLKRNIFLTSRDHHLNSHLTYKGSFKQLLMTMLRSLSRVKAKLELKEGATPKFCKARPVPYSLLNAVEEEYDHLE